MKMSSVPLRIAAFGFRHFPPRQGSAGADKFAMELLPRLVERGHAVTAYNRVYPGMDEQSGEVQGVTIKSFATVASSGFDTLLHSAKVTYDIIRNNTADVVHIQNGGNSIFGAILRLFGKRTFLSQDGLDWERDKWSWYAKAYLRLSSALTARVHNAVIFDNVFARQAFEQRFDKTFDFIPFGADVKYDPSAEAVFERLGLVRGEYLLFVGRFIPDKGLHWLLPAFARVATDKKLVLVGGSPNGSDYENGLRQTTDPRVLFAGFLYGPEVHALMRSSYAYVQPSAIEGLSPVILEAAYLGAPILCTDIPENAYGIAEHGIYFRKGDVEDIAASIQWAIDNPEDLRTKAASGSDHVRATFSWDAVVDQHVAIFSAAEKAALGDTTAGSP